MADFTIRKGDTRPILTDTLTYSDGSTVNLTGSSVKFVMRALTGTGPTTNTAEVTKPSCAEHQVDSVEFREIYSVIDSSSGILHDLLPLNISATCRCRFLVIGAWLRQSHPLGDNRAC